MSDPHQSLLDELCRARQSLTLGPEIRPLTRAWLDHLLSILFPQLSGSERCSREELAAELHQVQDGLAVLLQHVKHPAPGLPAQFCAGLHALRAELITDAQAIFDGDPAAKSLDEVFLTYPGFFAIAAYRCAHRLFGAGVPLVPRLLTEYAHEKTGIDIHPGATIGPRFSIDHGTGVVIGETTVIGKNVKLFQGVTLGALTVAKERADQKRHPTLEDEVVIYAGATILGGNTVVGRGSVVAGNAWLTQSVPADSLVSRKSEVRPKTGGSADWLDFAI